VSLEVVIVRPDTRGTHLEERQGMGSVEPSADGK